MYWDGQKVKKLSTRNPIYFPIRFLGIIFVGRLRQDKKVSRNFEYSRSYSGHYPEKESFPKRVVMAMWGFLSIFSSKHL